MSETHRNRWLEREDDGELTIIRVLVEKLEITDTTRSVFEQIYTLVDDMGRNRLVLNLERVKYVSSLGLGKLVMLNRKVLATDGRLALCSLTPTVREVLTVSHLDQLFNIHPDEAAARAAS